MIYGAAHQACLAAPRRRRLGYVPDGGALGSLERSPLIRGLFVGASAKLAPHSKVGFDAPILDQGDFASCGGHGTVQCLANAYGSAGRPLGFVASPGWFYRLARRISTPATSADGPPLTDSGIDPTALISAVNLGIVPLGTDGSCPTVDGRYSDVDSTNINVDVALDAEIIGRAKSDVMASDIAIASGTLDLAVGGIL